MDKSKRTMTTTATIVILCLVMAMVAYYAYLSSQSQKRKEEANMTAVQSFLSRDMARDYPSTPKEVILYYNEFIKCAYSEGCTDEEIEDLCDRARELYDAELLANNERDIDIIRLKAEILDYANNKRRITNYSVASSTNVEYFTKDGYDCASILCNYTIVDGGKPQVSPTVYVLRRDENRRWKIMGWTKQTDVGE